MRVRIITIGTLRRFGLQNAQSVHHIEEWIQKVKRADWKTPADIQLDFPSADLLGRGSERVVFNLGGNRYRLICAYEFVGRRIRLFVTWIGTHAEYTKLCRSNDQYTIVDY